MWKRTEHKSPKSKVELQVSIIVKELAEISHITYAGQFEEWFKDKLKEVPRTNIFAAEYSFKATQRNEHSVEIWKMTTQGDFKTKFWTLDYIKE
jgi:hypothetical protein